MARHPFYTSKEWYRVRTLALIRDGYRCVVCGTSVREKGASRVDHIVDRKVAPALALDLGNLRVLCASCDNKRHSEKGTGIPKIEIGLNGYPIGERW
jgi:hypothetical protein